MAFARALFQARKIILMKWKSVTPPSVKSWIQHMGNTLTMEKYIYQHKENPGKFDRLWAAWLDTPGISPRELVQMGLLRCPYT